MKIVAGRGVNEDKERIRTVTQNIPDDLGLAINSNTIYNVHQALEVGKSQAR